MAKKYGRNGEYDSKEEAEFALIHDALQKEGIVKRWIREPFKLQVGVARFYTPDFLVVYAGRVEIVETKGFPFIMSRCPRCKAFFRDNVAAKVKKEAGIDRFMGAALWHALTVDTDVGKALGESIHLPVYWRLVEKEKKKWVTKYLVLDGKKIPEKKGKVVNSEFVHLFSP